MFCFKLLLICSICAFIFAKEEDVIDLGDADFSAGVAQHETALVMFYAPWCGHCKRLKPEFAKAAEDLIRNDPPVQLIKVDCTEAGKETCNKHSVSGYPTLKIFRNGELSQDYNGPREAPGIVKFMKAQVGPSSKVFTSEAQLEKILKAEPGVTVVGYFETDSELKTAFLQLADRLREKVQFAHTTTQEILDAKDLKDSIVLTRPAILSNKFEDDTVTYDGNPKVDDIKQFVTENYHGLVGWRKPDNRQDFGLPLIVGYYTVDYVKNPKGTNYWRNRILKVAKLYKGKLNFAISSKDELSQELNEFGVDYIKGDKPKILARDAKNQKFILSEEFSVEALEQFASDILNEKLEPYLKSEAIPESSEGPVTVVVAKNFDDVVINNGKDTLIEFYAPWCGHCKKLTPIYEEVATKLKNEDVVIAKMDATANDVPPSFDVRGFPTIYWAAADSKDEPQRYEGGREVDDFINFIAKHATNELKGFDRSGNSKGKTEL